MAERADRTGEAFGLYERACQLGAARGCVRQAAAMLRGQAGVSDERGALALLRRTCQGDDGAVACLALGDLLERGVAGVAAADPQQAVALYERACELGDAQGCVLLGRRLGDMEQAAALYERACGADEPAGCLLAGRARLEGRGVPVDVGLAAERFERGCRELASPRNCTALGLVYVEGPGGLEADEDRGKALLRGACEEGHGLACRNLGLLARRDGRQQVAERWLRRACRLGDQVACGAARR